MSIDSLINAYRPKLFEDVVGHADVVKSFQKTLDEGSSHAFLFIGPAGLGKTSLARLGARRVGTAKSNLIEIDAATYSGVDDMRALTATLAYRPLGKNNKKSIIVDECDGLSAGAFKSLLKSVEEPPDWVLWFFLTNNPAKVPDNIRSRCSTYTLKPLTVTVLFDYLMEIVAAEKFTTHRQVVELCAKMAGGSPRQALSNLAVCYEAADRAEAARLISNQDEETQGTPYLLAKAIADGLSWEKMQPILNSLSEQDISAEATRHVIRAYFTKVLLGQKDAKAACATLQVLDHFCEPFNPVDGLTPIVVAVGRVLFTRSV